jgi:hypothetical protein
MPYENWNEYFQEIEKKKQSYLDKYYIPSNDYREYEYKDIPSKRIGFSSKYWINLVENNPHYRAIFIPRISSELPFAEVFSDSKEITELENKVDNLKAKINELVAKLTTAYTTYTINGKEVKLKSVMEIRTLVDELKALNLKPIANKEIIQNLRTQNQDLLKKIYDAGVESMIFYSNPPLTLDKVIANATKKLGGEINSLKEINREALNECVRLDEINKVLLLKLAGIPESQMNSDGTIKKNWDEATFKNLEGKVRNNDWDWKKWVGKVPIIKDPSTGEYFPIPGAKSKLTLKYEEIVEEVSKEKERKK